MTRRAPEVFFPMLALSPAGGVRMVCAVANGLARAGIPVRIAAPPWASEPPVALAAGVERVVVDVPAGARTRYMRRLLRLIRETEGVVVATGYLTPALIHLADPPHARAFYMIQNYEPESHVRHGRRSWPARIALDAVARAGFRVPAYRIAVSEYVAERVGRGRIQEVIHPGIDARFIDRIPDDRAVPARGERLVAGLFPLRGETKGIVHAAAAISRLEEKRGDIAALVYDVDYPAEHLPVSFGRFGARAPGGSIADFYGACDVFVFPSLVEGFGLPPLEAMACGCAVVLADSGGVMDYARHEENCLVVAPADPDALRRAIERIADDEALRHRIVLGGYETAQRFPESGFVRKCCAAILRQLPGVVKRTVSHPATRDTSDNLLG